MLLRYHPWSSTRRMSVYVSAEASIRFVVADFDDLRVTPGEPFAVLPSEKLEEQQTRFVVVRQVRTNSSYALGDTQRVSHAHPMLQAATSAASGNQDADTAVSIANL